jgi:hypothetical protein
MAQYSVSRQNPLHAGNNDIHEVVMMADKNGNILNGNGSIGNIPLASGLIAGYSHINKFGATPGDISTGSIWDGNTGSITYNFPTVPSVVSVVSAQNSGAEVFIQGLDENYNDQSETISIGSTGVKTFLRVYRAYMVDTTNTANVIINIGAAEAAQIIANQAQTLMAVYTVPAGKTGYMLSLRFGSAKASTNSAMKYTLNVRALTDGGIFRNKGTYFAAGGQNTFIEYPVPLVFLEKSDIRVDAIAAQQTEVNSSFDIVLVDN